LDALLKQWETLWLTFCPFCWTGSDHDEAAIGSMSSTAPDPTKRRKATSMVSFPTLVAISHGNTAESVDGVCLGFFRTVTTHRHIGGGAGKLVVDVHGFSISPAPLDLQDSSYLNDDDDDDALLLLMMMMMMMMMMAHLTAQSQPPSPSAR